MRVLFSVMTPAFLKNFESVVLELTERGHEVHLAVHASTRARGAGGLDEKLMAASERVTADRAPTPRDDRWHDLALALRSCRDYLQFQQPWFHEPYRTRAEVRVPEWFQEIAHHPVAGRRLPHKVMAAAFPVLERAVPIQHAPRDYLAEIAPDVALFTPYIGLRTVQPDYLAAAQSLGIPTVACISSWDNLSSKSLMRPIPDLVTVWNETQRREAVELHGVPAKKVEVTGAQCFDEWFGWEPRPREEFLRQVGLDPERPYLLYTCFSPFKGAPSEAEFVEGWLRALRNAPDPLLREAGVLVRPHPKRGDQWSDVDFSGFGNVVIWPRAGEMVVDEQAKADFHDSIHHSSAVVGINTSAMIEAGVIGRPVHTVLAPGFWESQEGTLHFRYLREVGGGLLRVGRDMDEHVAQLSESMHRNGRPDEGALQFVREFVRPHGVDQPATPAFADAIERMATTKVRRRGTPVPLLALRPVLRRMADRERETRVEAERYRKERDQVRRERQAEERRQRARARAEKEAKHRANIALAMQRSRLIRVATLLGLAVTAVTALAIPAAGVAALAGADLPSSTVVLLAVCLLSGIQLVTLGLVGRYLGRVYVEIMRRPLADAAEAKDDDRPADADEVDE